MWPLGLATAKLLDHYYIWFIVMSLSFFFFVFYLKKKLLNIYGDRLDSTYNLFILGSCDSEWVQNTDSYLVFNLTSFGWLRKYLKKYIFSSIITEIFSEHLPKEFVETLKLSVFQ